MSKVRTLSEDVYKKIAAGEVVERPLSVVKELVENSIDAGADSITVEVVEGGKKLIKISDNGCGFHPDDIETAFKNHSTSKLVNLSDFDSLNTLGFRGEALPSILEVSRIELKTSDNNDGAGIACRFEAGQIVEKEQIAFNRGSAITVRDLFFNFPVRQKFLKAERTELNQIVSFLETAALANYGIGFELTHNGKTVFIYKKAASMQDRIYQVFGKDYLDTLQEVNYETETYHIKGFISKLNTGVSVKTHQYFFVNGRPVREKTLFAALNNSFVHFLEKSKYPVGVLALNIPPHEVDVNIHPMKLEIKFIDTNAIYRLIKNAIEYTLTGSTEIEVPVFSGGVGDISSRGSVLSSYNRSYQSQRAGSSQSLPRNDISTNPSQKEEYQAPPSFDQSHLFEGHLLNEDDFILIGQYRNSYILIEKNEELLIIDQHNAQERVNFDRLKKEYAEGHIASINPLFPVILELSPSEAGILDANTLSVLERTGFRLEPLSGHSFDVKGFPQVLGEKSIKDAILEIIHLPAEQLAVEDKVLAEVACKSAIKINHKLYPDQMKTIVRNLFKTSNPYFCPHKRPIIIDLTLEKIEKLLKRK